MGGHLGFSIKRLPPSNTQRIGEFNNIRWSAANGLQRFPFFQFFCIVAPIGDVENIWMCTMYMDLDTNMDMDMGMDMDMDMDMVMDMDTDKDTDMDMDKDMEKDMEKDMRAE